MLYYSGDEIRKTGSKYMVIFGERSNGKSYDVLRESVEHYFATGQTIAILRRLDSDFEGKNGSKTIFENLMCDGNGINQIKLLSGGQFDGVLYWAGRIYLAIENEDGRLIRTPQEIAYAFSISSYEKYKTAQFPKLGRIIFEEFLTAGMYLRDEFVMFTNMISTLVRARDDILIYMLGNTVDYYSPYWREMGITRIRKMRPGDLDIYEYGDSGLRVAVEYARDSAEGKPSDVYFAFDNPKLRMITDGDWAIGTYPHCPVQIRPRDISMVFFIRYSGELLQCEFVTHDSGPFIFIHRKTTPIQDPDRDVVFDLDVWSNRKNLRRDIMRDDSRIAEVFRRLYRTDRIFYQDNTVGEQIRAYLNDCG